MKQNIEDLVVFGGTPAFQNGLHVGGPNIGDREQLLERINDILDRRWLTNNGLYVQEFEQRIADFVGVKHCIAMCNATIALEIAIRAVGLSGEVIIPSMTFIATAHALQWQEITPVFCDIDPQTLCIDPVRVEELITPRTSGIIGVHLFGHTCDTAALHDIAMDYELKLIFDAAHAFCCSRGKCMVGNFGNAEIFSFHATKFLNSFEGGAIATNDDELATKIRLMKNFGFSGLDNVIYIGTNGKMSEVSAAMGITSLENMERVVEANRNNYYTYRNELDDIPGIKLHQYNESEKCNFQYIVLLVDENGTNLTRDQLIQVLVSENILARRYFYPGCHKMEPYRSYFPHSGLLLPVTEQTTEQILCLPTGTSVTTESVLKICNIIKFAVSNADVIKKHLVLRGQSQ